MRLDYINSVKETNKSYQDKLTNFDLGVKLFISIMFSTFLQDPSKIQNFLRVMFYPAPCRELISHLIYIHQSDRQATNSRTKYTQAGYGKTNPKMRRQKTVSSICLSIILLEIFPDPANNFMQNVIAVSRFSQYSMIFTHKITHRKL